MPSAHYWKTPERRIADAIARRWAAPWQATCGLLVVQSSQPGQLGLSRAEQLERYRKIHDAAYRACLSAGFSRASIVRGDLDDPRISEEQRRERFAKHQRRRENELKEGFHHVANQS